MSLHGSTGDAAFDLGRETLGPIFASFALLLLRHVQHAGCERLGFVARDGDLLMKVVAAFADAADIDHPPMTYLHLSRRSTNLPAHQSIGLNELAEAMAVCADRGNWKQIFEYLGLSLPLIRPILTRLGFDPVDDHITESAMAVVANDSEFQTLVRAESERQRDLLAAYLARMKIGWGPPTMLVDIGWRGSILSNLHQTFSSDASFCPPTGAFFCLWVEDQQVSKFPSNSIGLISDMRRKRGMTEGSAWYAAYLLEATCRADEGTTVAYELQNGETEPVLDENSPGRQAEKISMNIANQIRSGILARVRTIASDPSWRQAPDAKLRRTAQHALLRLAYFPSTSEMAILAPLIHTEGHAGEWSAPLIANTRPNPLRAPRKWLAGLSSPWRSGYVRITGGPLLACAFFLIELILLALPPNARTLLETTARSVAGLGHRR
ncbi:MAG: hypothetical protein K9J74_03870 [Sulfuritalea sp.]|nr:hypothetical protein [Sulfuritalea sp.]